MKFYLSDYHSGFQLQSDKFRKSPQSLANTQPVSHLTMTHSIDRVISQSICKIVYIEFDHVLIKFIQVIKTHTFEDFRDCILTYVRV